MTGAGTSQLAAAGSTEEVAALPRVLGLNGRWTPLCSGRGAKPQLSDAAFRQAGAAPAPVTCWARISRCPSPLTPVATKACTLTSRPP
jgi:hypothetical protein